MRPLARQARQVIFVLCQFHLQHAFAGVRVLGKNVEDQPGAVHDADFLAEHFFQFALVARVEFIVEDDHLRQGLLHEGFEFLHFARADERHGVRTIQFLRQFADHVQAGGIGQQG